MLIMSALGAVYLTGMIIFSTHDKIKSEFYKMETTYYRILFSIGVWGTLIFWPIIYIGGWLVALKRFIAERRD